MCLAMKSTNNDYFKKGMKVAMRHAQRNLLRVAQASRLLMRASRPLELLHRSHCNQSLLWRGLHNQQARRLCFPTGTAATILKMKTMFNFSFLASFRSFSGQSFGFLRLGIFGCLLFSACAGPRSPDDPPTGFQKTMTTVGNATWSSTKAVGFGLGYVTEKTGQGLGFLGKGIANAGGALETSTKDPFQ